MIMARSGYQSQGARLIGGSDALLLRQVQYAEDAAHSFLAKVLILARRNAPMCGPAFSARCSSCSVLNGVRAVERRPSFLPV
jgi:hypothetical protein